MSRTSDIPTKALALLEQDCMEMYLPAKDGVWLYRKLGRDLAATRIKLACVKQIRMGLRRFCKLYPSVPLEPMDPSVREFFENPRTTITDAQRFVVESAHSRLHDAIEAAKKTKQP